MTAPCSRTAHGLTGLRLGPRALAALLCLLAIAALILSTTSLTRADTLTGASTTGTASTVSPSTIAEGGTISYTLSGFPASTEVEVLVDDGRIAGVDSPSASLGTLTTGSDGAASGHVSLPKTLVKGAHWLRFRAEHGDWTNKSPYFTVSDVSVIGGTSQADAGATADPASLSQASAGASPAATAASATATAQVAQVVGAANGGSGAAPGKAVQVPGASSSSVSLGTGIAIVVGCAALGALVTAGFLRLRERARR